MQNSIDAEADLVQISFENSRDVLQIKDDGLGMTEKELERAIKVGISQKKPDHVGWRGIGFWSGVPVSKRIVVITKSERGKKLRLEINNDIIRRDADSDKPATQVLTDATGNIEELPITKAEEGKHYTIVRLESVLRQQRGIFTDERIKAYLSSTLPLAFAKTTFPQAEQVEKILQSRNVLFRKVQVDYQGDMLYRPPTRGDVFIGKIVTKEFKVKGKIAAVGWFLTTNNNRVVAKPNSGIIFRKKGFTIGDETLVTKEWGGKTYHRWQYGEIHVTSPELRENASRNNFEYNNEILGPFLDDVGKFIGELEKLNRYISDKTAPTEIRNATDAMDRDEFTMAKRQLTRATKKMKTQRTFPKEPALKQMKAKVDAVSKKDSGRIAKLATRANKAIAASKGISVAGKERLQDVIGNLHPGLKKSMPHVGLNTIRSLATTNTDGLVSLLKKKTGSTSNELHTLTQEAYDWSQISPRSKTSNPTLTLMGQFHPNTDKKLANRNRSIGAMAYAIHDLFVNTAKHGKGEDCFAWYENAPSDEKDHICADMLAAVDLMYRLIDKSTQYKPMP